MNLKNNFLKIGLTGGIASGKSSVSHFLKEMGFFVFDADQIARDLRMPGAEAYDEILNFFGTTDRKKLREMIFANPEAKKKLESILHPKIKKKFSEKLKSIPSESEFVFYEASLLIETNQKEDFDCLVLITTPLELRVERICQRDGVSKEDAKRIISSQLSDEEKKKFSDFIIENNSDLESLRQQTNRLIDYLRHRIER